DKNFGDPPHFFHKKCNFLDRFLSKIRFFWIDFFPNTPRVKNFQKNVKKIAQPLEKRVDRTYTLFKALFLRKRDFVWQTILLFRRSVADLLFWTEAPFTSPPP